MPVSSSIHASIVSRFTKSAAQTEGLAIVQQLLEFALDSGTGPTQADKVWADTRTLAASSNEDLDLVGNFLDTYGVTFSPAKIVSMLVSAAAGNTNNVVLGAAAATQFVGPFGAATHTHAIKPGGFWFWFAPPGWPVAAGSDFFRVTNGAAGTPVTYSILAVARSV